MTESSAASENAAAENPAAATLTAPRQLIVGGFTSEMGGGAEGLTMYLPETPDADADPDGAAEPDVTFRRRSAAELTSPSYVIKHPDFQWLYAVHESSPGKVSALRYDAKGGVHLVNTVDSGGDGGCHLCFDSTKKFVVVAHYSSGSIASFKIEENGALSERIGLLEFSGSGPDPERQEAAHAHQVVSVGGSILVADLGTDSVHIVRIDEDGNLTPATDSITLPPGSGPRHLVLSGRHLVVACELNATLWVSAEVGSEGKTVPTSTRQTDQRIYPSAIAKYGDQIVVANRGADTLSVFTLDAYGTPHPLVEIDCGGAWPRDLTVDDDQIWVANQQSDNVTVIKPTAVSGNPEDWRTVLQLPSPSPACVVPAR
jgi:6-phosphogluconolactonase (cycloisomerase 2 family)